MQRDDNSEAAWDAVRVIKIRGEAKIAWQRLWQLVRRRPDSVWISYAELGAYWGCGEREGRRAINTLREARLIEEMESLPGRVRVYVREPREVVSPPCDRTGDKDRPLFDRLMATDAPHVPPPGTANPAPSSADVVQHPPADVAQEPPAEVAQQPPNAPNALARGELARAAPFTFETVNATPLCPSLPAVPLKPKAPTGSARHRGSADVAPQPPASGNAEADFLAELARRQRIELERISSEAEPTHAGHAITSRFAELLTKLPGDSDRAGAVTRLATRIQKRVGGLRLAPAVRVARAVVYGELPEAELETILADLEAAQRSGLRLPPFAYFVKCAKNAFARYDLAWPIDGTPAVRHQPR